MLLVKMMIVIVVVVYITIEIVAVGSNAITVLHGRPTIGHHVIIIVVVVDVVAIEHVVHVVVQLIQMCLSLLLLTLSWKFIIQVLSLQILHWLVLVGQNLANNSATGPVLIPVVDLERKGSLAGHHHGAEVGRMSLLNLKSLLSSEMLLMLQVRQSVEVELGHGGRVSIHQPELIGARRFCRVRSIVDQFAACTTCIIIAAM